MFLKWKPTNWLKKGDNPGKKPVRTKDMANKIWFRLAVREEKLKVFL